MSETSGSNTGEFITLDEAREFVANLITDRDYGEHTEADNALFLTHTAHWSMEIFGQCNSDGIYSEHQRFAMDEGFPYEELPDDLKHVVLSEAYGQIYEGNHNRISMWSAPTFVEEPPFIPKHYKLVELNFPGQIKAMADDPEIMRGLVPSKFYFLPGIEIKFMPDFYKDWGLQYLIDQNGFRLIPFGTYGKTETPFRYAAERVGQNEVLAKTLGELIILTNKYVEAWRRPIDATMIPILRNRLEGTMGIPSGDLKPQGNPHYALTNELIRQARKAADWDELKPEDF